MSTATASKYKTQCRLCPIADENPPLNIPLRGKPSKDAEKFTEKLLKHLMKKHGPELKEGLGLLDQYKAFLILSQFESEDPSVKDVLEAMRADIFSRCRKNVPDDADIAILASRAGFSTMEDQETAIAAMRALRDLCCETGPHAPKLP